MRDYMEYHADRFEDHSVLIYSDGKPVAVFPCTKDCDSFVSHAGLTYGGLLCDKSIHASDVIAIFQQLGEYFRSMGGKRLIYKAVPHVFHTYPAEEDLYALFRLNARLTRRDISSVIEIAKRPKFSDSRKNTARKSEKAGVELSECVSFEEFHILLSSVLVKFGKTPVHSLDELNLLKSRFPENIRLFGAVLDGSLLAASLVYDFGHIVHTQYMASSETGRNLGALDFLLIYLVSQVFGDRKYFSFGVSTEDQGRFMNEGLIRQKEGFGGRAVVYDFYEWEL